MCNFLICQNVVESNISLHHVSNKVILNLNVLGFVMKHGILCETYPINVFVIYHCSL